MIPDWAIPFLHFWAANVTSIALIGVVALVFLYAIKSWQGGRRRRSLSAGRIWWLAAAAALVSSIPIHQTLVSAWTVRLVDDKGAPVAGVPVAQHLMDEGAEIDDLEPLLTDSSGAVQFPARVKWTSLARLAVGRVMGWHRVEADVWIPRNPIAEPLVLHQGVGAECEDRACAERELGSELRVRRLQSGARPPDLD